MISGCDLDHLHTIQLFLLPLFLLFCFHVLVQRARFLIGFGLIFG